MSKIKICILFNLIFISSLSFAQETNFWPSQLGLPLKDVKQNILNEYKTAKIEEYSDHISIDKVIILQRESSILAQVYDGRIYIIGISFSTYPADLFKDLNTYFIKKHGKSIHPYANKMYKEQLANDNKIAFWDVKKYSIMISLSTFGLNLQYIDTDLYQERQKSWLKQLNEEKNKF